MKLLYLGGLCTDAIFENIIKEGHELSQAAFKLEKQLMMHFIEDKHISKEDITIISSLPYEGDAPRTYSDEWFGVDINYVWNNHSSIKDILKSWKTVLSHVKAWEKKTRGEERIVLTYATDIVLLFPMLFDRLIHKDIKIATICSEIPQYRNYSYTSRLKGLILKKAYTFLNESMDGYIFLSRYMNEVCNNKRKPWIVVEGVPEIKEVSTVYSEQTGNTTIVYAGGFDPGYGIEELLEAMSFVKHKDAKLLICGSGGLLPVVKKYETENGNIKYLGRLPNEQVMEIERESAILINPRKSDLMLTRYAFPSKTLEYFSNGYAVSLITRLDGIPEEYYSYCYLIEHVTPEHIAQQIDHILDIDIKERYKKAKAAYEFVRTEKSASAQTRKIYKFIEGLSK